MNRIHPTLAGLAFVALVAIFAAPLSADVKDDIGYTALEARLGGATPDGTGIDVAQIEALVNSGDSGSYFPDPSVEPSEFGSKTITDQTGVGTDSSHARAVARRFHGDVTSMSSGITSIDAYSVSDWLGGGQLQTDGLGAPLTATRRIYNHSWVGNFDPEDEDVAIDALRRTDHLVWRDDVVVAAAVSANGSGAAVPDLMTNAYNIITVGVSDGTSTDDLTTLDAAGRVAPHIVVPESATSYATPYVSSAAALLLETADGSGALSNATHAVTVKALLLGGATKDEFDLDGSTGGTLDDWSRTTTRGLDRRYGAGELNVDNSHRILEAGEQEASNSSDVGLTGWDYDDADDAAANLYFFETEDAISELSILLTWFREVTDGIPGPLGYDPQVDLANLDLTLYEATGFTLGDMVDESVSTVDNVEHIFGQNLAAGRYAISVSTDQDWTYALTWDVQTVPEPTTLALLLIGGLIPLAAAQRRRRRAA